MKEHLQNNISLPKTKSLQFIQLKEKTLKSIFLLKSWNHSAKGIVFVLFLIIGQIPGIINFQVQGIVVMTHKLIKTPINNLKDMLTD